MTTPQSGREAFEAWAISESLNVLALNSRGDYRIYSTYVAWQAWQAALAQQGREVGEPVAWQYQSRHGDWVTVVSNEPWASKGFPVRAIYTAAPKQQAVDGWDDGVRKAAHALIDLIVSFDDRDLLALDADKHPPSSLSVLAADLREALAALPGKTEVECNCPGSGKVDPSLHAPNCPARKATP